MWERESRRACGNRYFAVEVCGHPMAGLCRFSLTMC